MIERSTIRLATNKDIAGITTLLQEVLSVHHEGRPDLFKAEGSKYSPEQLERLIAQTNTPVFVYVDEHEQVLGHCFCVLTKHEETNSTYAYDNLYIDDLCVKSSARRLHIGSQLYEYVERYAKEHDVYNVTLHAWACNLGAVEFYQRLGLVPQYYALEKIIQK